MMAANCSSSSASGGYLVLFIVGGVVFPDVLRAAEQVRAVAQSSHIHGVKGELILRHDIDRHMGEVEVFQLTVQM